MNKAQKYLALDLELNNAQDNSTPTPKIIQVGVAIGSYDDYMSNTIETYKWYLDPGEPIFPFITDLTGITDYDVTTRSASHETVAQQLGNLIKTNNTFINPITWGGGDSSELLQEFRDRTVDFPHFGRRWIDVKTWYVLHMLAEGKKPAGGLSSAMGKSKLQFQGLAHRADVDAFNTLRLFFHLVNHQAQMNTAIKLVKEL